MNIGISSLDDEWKYDKVILSQRASFYASIEVDRLLLVKYPSFRTSTYAYVSDKAYIFIIRLYNKHHLR